jgi:epoxyqueuosine reductase
MNKGKLLEKFHTVLKSKGYEGRIVSANHVQDILNDIKKLDDHKEIYPALYQQYKNLFEFKPEASFSSIKSLIIVAIPVPQFKVTFRLNNKDLSLVVPPTYLYSQKIIDETQKLLYDIFSVEGYNVAYARIPFKTLAVRSGLARYGRNNISYISNMGSFYRLCGYYSDFESEEDNWHEFKMMKACKKCSACRLNCPTGAISNDRFLLHVERCLTYHNEQPREMQFPQWIKHEWHNCLVGCLKCQKICPENKMVKDWIEIGPSFTQQETELFLREIPFNELPEQTKEKLKKSELDEYAEVFSRNLQPFLN